MKIANPEKRLSSLWGMIDRQHNHQIANFLAPNSTVLDVGCGYGSLVNYLIEKGHAAEGVDIDPDSVQIAHRLFPNAKITQTSAESLIETASSRYDAIILKDCLHHIMGEHDPISAFIAFQQLLKPNGRVIILDPNPMLILRISRRLIGHVDPEATLPAALQLLDRMNFSVKQIRYFEVIGLPLSGGYVGLQLVPNVAILNRSVAGLNHVLSNLMNAVSGGSIFCWRYVVAAQKR